MSTPSTPRFMASFWSWLFSIVVLDVSMLAVSWSIFFPSGEAAPASALKYFLIAVATPFVLGIAGYVSALGSLEDERPAVGRRRWAILCALFLVTTLAAAIVFRGETLGTAAGSLLHMSLVIFLPIMLLAVITLNNRAINGLRAVDPGLVSIYLESGFLSGKGTDKQTLGWLRTGASTDAASEEAVRSRADQQARWIAEGDPRGVYGPDSGSANELRKLLHSIALHERSAGVNKIPPRFARARQIAEALSLGAMFLFLAWTAFGGTIPTSGPVRTAIAALVGSALFLIVASACSGAIRRFAQYRKLGAKAYNEREALRSAITKIGTAEFPKLLEAHAAGEPLRTEHPLMVSAPEASADGGGVSR